jgi:nucleotide sugar dehydrogenase
MIAINLDVKKQYDVSGNLAHEVLERPYLECVENIAQHLDEKTLVILESTLPVGFTENKVQPIIQAQFSERRIEIDQILLGHSYERVTPGKNYLNSMKNFYRVYSGVNDASKLATRNFLSLVVNTTDFELTELESPRASEMAKLLENSYRSMNIAFAVEWSRFAESMCVNLYEVVDAVRKRPTHANLMYPGIGVGGYCLTKDGLIADRSFKSGALSMTVNAIVETDRMPSYALNFVKSKLNHSEPIKSSKAIIAGVAYAPGVGDTRFSPVEKFAKEIGKEFVAVYYVDPYVNYWEEMDVPIHQNFDNITTVGVEAIFICTKHTEFYEMLKFLPSTVKKVINLYDLVGLYQNPQNRQQKEMFKNYFLLGAG